MLQLKNKVILLVACGSAALMCVWGCSKPGGGGESGSNVNPPPPATLYPINVTLKMDNPQPGTTITLQNNASDDLVFSESDLKNGTQKSFHKAFPENWAYAISVSTASPIMVKCDFTPASFGNVKSEPVNITGSCSYDAPILNMAAELDSGSRDFIFSLSDPNSFKQQNVTLKFNITTTPSKNVVINIDNTKSVPTGWDTTVIGNRDPHCDNLQPGVWCKIKIKGIIPQAVQNSGSITVPLNINNATYDPATAVIKYTINP